MPHQRNVGVSWGHVGGILGVSCAIAGDLRAIVMLTWGHLGRISGCCGGGLRPKSGAPAEATRSFSYLGVILAVFGCLGPSWGPPSLIVNYRQRLENIALNA